MRDRPSLARIVTVYTWPATAAWIGGPVGSVRRAKAEHTYVYVGRPGVVDSVLRFGPDSDFIIGGHSAITGYFPKLDLPWPTVDSSKLFLSSKQINLTGLEFSWHSLHIQKVRADFLYWTYHSWQH